MLQQIILHYGYWAIGLGTFLEGETVVIAGGALAHRGLLSLPLVMLGSFMGSVLGDQMWFQLGHRYGRRLLARRAHWEARARQVQGWMARYGTVYVLGFRFLYGLRTVSPLLLGSSRYPELRFAVLNTIGGAIWASAFSFAGWLLGAGMSTVMRRTGHVQELLLGAAALTALFLLVRRALRLRKQHRDRSRQRHDHAELPR